MVNLSSKLLVKLSHAAFVDVVKMRGKPKDRSQMTFEKVHKPALDALNKSLSNDETRSAAPTASKAVVSDALQTLQIGDSLLERLKTFPPDLEGSETDGKAPSSLQATPFGSLGTEHVKKQSVRIATIPSSLNLGVGGDKIENVLYRLSLGTYDLLLPHSQDLKLVIVHVGTNNLRPKRSLTPEDLANYGLLIKALLRIAPKSQILCSGLFRRKDVPDSIVVQSNADLNDVVDELNGKGGHGVEEWMGRVRFVPAPSVRDEDLEDHVHLNLAGYRLWDGALWPLIEDCLE